MRQVLQFLLLSLTAILATSVSTSQSGLDRDAREQIRGVRRLAGLFLECIQSSLSRSTVQQNHHQFRPFINYLQWALDDSKVFQATNPSKVEQSLSVLNTKLSSSEFFNSVVPKEQAEKFMNGLIATKAAWSNNFDPDHLVKLGKAISTHLHHLGSMRNGEIQERLLLIGFNSKFVERSRITNSAANFLHLMLSEPGVQLDDNRAEWFEFQFATRFVRRVVHYLLPLPCSEANGRFFMDSISGLHRALANNELDQFIDLKSKEIIGKIPALGSNDVCYMGSIAKYWFFSSNRLTKFIKTSLAQFLQVYRNEPMKAADFFAIGFLYTVKSFTIGTPKLGETFISRLLDVTSRTEYHVALSIEKMIFKALKTRVD